ncbi:unnamed protein product [Pleuronectes platessa]|uniref:Uncharacterized protein n=1 Tax=Pleuronectes platessa TaxID=8262 RepID=A0A9N7ZBH7_PLEPL|nr:unnamed protein product [Pleuronectes platessa]
MVPDSAVTPAGFSIYRQDRTSESAKEVVYRLCKTAPWTSAERKMRRRQANQHWLQGVKRLSRELRQPRVQALSSGSATNPSKPSRREKRRGSSSAVATEQQLIHILPATPSTQQWQHHHTIQPYPSISHYQQGHTPPRQHIKGLHNPLHCTNTSKDKPIPQCRNNSMEV